MPSLLRRGLLFLLSRYYVMRNHVVEKVLKLTRRKEKYLVVAAVRFLRTCIALKVGLLCYSSLVILHHPLPHQPG